MLVWALLADVMPIYPLYALLFTDSGLSGAEVSALFAIWSGVAILTEVPSGALADRFSRRNCLVFAAVFQGAGYAAWMLVPSFAGFALGFVLWGVGGSLVSGAQEALLYDGLADAGAQGRYAQVNGWVTAVQLGAQVPAAVLATSLFATGGYALAGWASVGACLAAAFVAARLPEPPRGSAPDDEDDAGYFATLRAGLVEAAHRPGVRGVLVAAAALTAFDAVEEYFPLILAGWGLPTVIIPVADLPIVLAGMAGAALAGAASRLRPVGARCRARGRDAAVRRRRPRRPPGRAGGGRRVLRDLPGGARRGGCATAGAPREPVPGHGDVGGGCRRRGGGVRDLRRVGARRGAGGSGVRPARRRGVAAAAAGATPRRTRSGAGSDAPGCRYPPMEKMRVRRP